MSKRQNNITWERVKAALAGSIDITVSRDFRMQNGKMVTYEQQKLGLNAYCNKHWVLPNGIHTEPIQFHIV